MWSPKPFTGEALAFATALVWAAAVVLFKKSGEKVHPLALNLFKDVLALVLFVPTVLVFGQKLTPDVPASYYGWLLASGALGIGVGDTLFFASLNRLGAGLSAVVVCMYAPFTVGLSAILLGERMGVWQLAGVALISAAVLTAGTVDGPGTSVSKRRFGTGLVLGLVSQAAMALGIVAVKPILEQTALLWAAEVRLVGGVAALAIILLLRKDRRAVLATLGATGSFGYTAGASFMGAYLAMILWIGGMKYAPVSVAAALNQISNVFVFIFAALFLREPVTWRRVVALAMAVGGAALVVFAKGL